MAALALGAGSDLAPEKTGLPGRGEGLVCAEQEGNIFLVALEPAPAGELKREPCPDAIRFLLGQRINVNRASFEELVMLPLIGEKSARTIIEYRGKNRGIASGEEFDSIPGLSSSARDSLKTWADVK